MLDGRICNMDRRELEPWKTHPEILRLREQLQAEPTFPYASSLSHDISTSAIFLDPPTLSQSDFHLEDETDGEERHERLLKKVTQQREFQVELIHRRTRARNRLVREFERREEAQRKLQEETAYQTQSHYLVSSKHSLRAEHRLHRKLKSQDGAVTVDMREGDDILFSGALRAYSVTWKRRPQPLEVRIHQCRTVREKLEEGRYSMRVRVWDRLGGRPIGFTREDPSFWHHQTSKVLHTPASWSLTWDESLHLLAPSEHDLHPSMLLIFELLSHTTRDEIIGTAIFPLCNSALDYSQGQFKTPILRGILHRRVHQFSEMERLYSANVDDWLCNLYFEIRKQTVLLAGEREYAVVMTAEPGPLEQVTSRGFQKNEYETLRTPDQFAGFRQSVSLDENYGSVATRARFLAVEMREELGVGRGKDLAVTVAIGVLWAWVSRYTHYIGEYLFLKQQRVPVTAFEVKAYTIDLQYPGEMSLEVELGATLLGPIFTLVCFIFLSLSAYTAFKTLRHVPFLCYRFLSIFGLISILDGLITAIEVPLRAKSDGDIYKLYNYFGREEGSPAIGAFLTAFLYLGLAGIALFVVYLYLLYCHLDGRLLDVYVRLTAPESHFYLPRDSEVSARYLDWVLYKARNYYASNGDKRRIFLSEFTQSGHSYRHICIYTEGINHSRLLYRHFLILHTGAMCELELTHCSFI